MALIESLKAFYKDNVENVDKLNNADSILEVLRAKYGNYKGSNIEEYFKELVNNGISPGGGGGGGIVYPTFTIAQSGSTCDMTFAEINANYQASDMGQWGIAVLVHPVYGKRWIGIGLTSGSFLDYYEDVPETVSEGFKLLLIGEKEPIALYADDDNFYFPKE